MRPRSDHPAPLTASLRISFDFFEMGLQFVSFPARCLQVEEKILDIELELIDRILSDANKPALQTREMPKFIA